MMRREDGFSLVELMVTMVIFIFVIVAASQVFTGLLGQYKQQSKISETNIEGVVGLDILRRDIEHGGYGLPWDLGGASYGELGDLTKTPWADNAFCDSPPNNPGRPGEPPDPANYPPDMAGGMNPPAAFRSGDNAGEFCNPATGNCISGSDVLVIKGTSVAQNAASQKWSYVTVANTVKEWGLEAEERERMETGDWVIVLELGTLRKLVVNPGPGFKTRYKQMGAYMDVTPDQLLDDVFAPPEDTLTRVAYGVAGADATTLLRPFNRADYYIKIPTTAMPLRCAADTGILYKATFSQEVTSAGSPTVTSELPLLDCVADMQVQYFTASDGKTVDNYGGDISGRTAAQLRDQLKGVRVSVLAHEGQRDTGFTFTNFTGAATCPTCIRVGTNDVDGRDFDLSTIPNYENYRWKVYTMTVQPVNLR